MSIRRPQTPLLVASLVIALCLTAMGYALALAVTGDEGYKLPETIESVDPVPAGQGVPAQTSVFVDLLAGYTGVLVVDGLELETVNIEDLQDKNKPGQQITLPPTTIFEPGNATLTFRPSPEADIDKFTGGEHIVQVIYWKLIDSRASARSYTWSFNVF